LVFNEDVNIKKGLINPLDDGLMWLRGMDTDPLLTSKDFIENNIKFG
jgi:carbamoyl-phosphate synthase large subunit